MDFWRRWFRRELSCSQVHRLASDYLDRELSPPLAERVKRHLSWCPACLSFVQTLQFTLESLRRLPPRRAPRELKDRLLRGMGEGPTKGGA